MFPQRPSDAVMKHDRGMDLIGIRLRAARKSEGLTQAELAKRAGISQNSVSDLERGRNIASRNIVALAKALRRRPEWLSTGALPEFAITETPVRGENVRPIVTNGLPAYPRVPLISDVAAGMLGSIEDFLYPGEAERWVEARQTRPGARAFALEVVGDSMVNPLGSPSFPPGAVLIVDPDRAATPGAFVVAKDVQTQRATFKRLAHDAGRWYLRPLNPAYPTVEIDSPDLRVIGVVIEMSLTIKL
jgi:SOS-response transcriptional repressor LexA